MEFNDDNKPHVISSNVVSDMENIREALSRLSDSIEKLSEVILPEVILPDIEQHGYWRPVPTNSDILKRTGEGWKDTTVLEAEKITVGTIRECENDNGVVYIRSYYSSNPSGGIIHTFEVFQLTGKRTR